MARSNRYTLFCSTGGYDGPYLSLDEAETAAQRKLDLNRNERWIEICPCVDNAPYTPHHYKPYGRPVKRISRSPVDSEKPAAVGVEDPVHIPEVLPAGGVPAGSGPAISREGMDIWIDKLRQLHERIERANAVIFAAIIWAAILIGLLAGMLVSHR